MTTSKIPGSNHVVRTGKAPVDNIEGLPSVPPADFIDLGPLDPSDLRGFSPKSRVTSADWEEHGACKSVPGLIQRGSDRGDTHAYRSLASRVEEPVEIGQKSVTPSALHWPEPTEEAHSHILVDNPSKLERVHVREALRLRFALVRND
jgi:hypothetical protein